jgi:hypothetical protein
LGFASLSVLSKPESYFAHFRQIFIDLHPKHAVQCVGGDALRTQNQDQADMKASKGTQCQEQAGMEHLKILYVRASQVCSKVDRMERSHFLRQYIS